MLSLPYSFQAPACLTTSLTCSETLSFRMRSKKVFWHGVSFMLNSIVLFCLSLFRWRDVCHESKLFMWFKTIHAAVFWIATVYPPLCTTISCWMLKGLRGDFSIALFALHWYVEFYCEQLRHVITSIQLSIVYNVFCVSGLQESDVWCVETSGGTGKKDACVGFFKLSSLPMR